MNMMDPDMIRLAQEQMSRMSPADLARIQQQMISNPELLKMASESMKNFSSEDFKFAAQQLKNARPEEMAEIGDKMANASPDEIEAMRAHADAQIGYKLSAAEMLKKQGNQLHSQGRYKEAMQKYLLAKKNMISIPSSKARALALACSLNLMSCYLKTEQYDECITEGSEVLAYDAKNLKALYRRGQAYTELGQLDDAVADLSIANELSPDDETIAEILRDAKEKLTKEGGNPATKRFVIEGINEVENMPSGSNMGSSNQHRDNASASRTVEQPKETNKTGSVSTRCTVEQPNITDRSSTRNNMNLQSNSESLEALRNDPEAVRSFQNFISNADSSTLTSISGKSGEVSPDMVKVASNMMSKMSSGELQKMLDMASSFQGGNLFSDGSSNNPSFDGPSIPANMTPQMLKTATDMMSKMSPDNLQNMFQMASSMKGEKSVPNDSIVNKMRPNSLPTKDFLNGQGTSALNDAVSESSSSRDGFSNLGASQPNFPSTADLQEQMRNQMKDPAMQQMFSSMVKNISPQMMANMSEQFGIKLSPEDAAKAQQAMSSLSPEQLDKMMRWADRIQRGADGVKKTKNWLLGRPGMILAICMLLFAVILHRLGFIGV